MKRGVLVGVFLVIAFLSLQIIFAEHLFSPASFSKEINQVSSFSITLNNTDNEDALTFSNITEVNITLPAGLTFISDTNSTNSVSFFTNNSATLTWINVSYVIGSFNGGSNLKTFSFSANSISLGSYNIIVKTTNSSSTIENDIPLTIADTTKPVLGLITPTDNEINTNRTVVFKCGSTDNFMLKTVVLYIYLNNTEVYRNNQSLQGTSNETIWTYHFTGDGNYLWNCFLNDSSGNGVWGANRTIKVNTTPACTPQWDCGFWGVCIGRTQTRVCIDLNNCNNNSTKPNENQSCCTQNWNCTAWLPAICPREKTQIRTCQDTMGCNNNTNKPSETKTCEYNNPGGTVLIIIIVVTALIIGTLIFLILKNRNKVNSQSTQNSFS
jgi:hypothetical protein